MAGKDICNTLRHTIKGITLSSFWNVPANIIFLPITTVINLCRSATTTLAPVFLSSGISAVTNGPVPSPLVLFGKQVGMLYPSQFLYIWGGLLAADRLLLSLNEIIISSTQVCLTNKLVGKQLLPQLHKLNIEELEKKGLNTNELPNLINRLTGDISSLLSSHVNQVVPIFFNGVMITVFLATNQSGGATGVVVGFVSLNALINTLAPFIDKNRQSETELAVNKFCNTLAEDMRNVRTIRSYNQIELSKTVEQTQFKKFSNQIVCNDLVPSIFRLFSSKLALLGFTMGTIGYYANNGHDITRDELDELILIINYFYVFYNSTEQVGKVLYSAFNTERNIEKIKEIIASKELENNSSKDLIDQKNDSSVPAIEFKNVTVTVIEPESGKEKNIIEDVSFKINKGESCALIGKSGSGKSTILGLICGFVKATNGEILIDGKNINNFSTKDLRNLITLINQQTELFNMVESGLKVEFNVLYGHEFPNEILKIKTEKTEKDGNKISLLSDSQLFFNEVKKSTKLDHVSSNVQKLSGGEKQRIGWARAWRKKPIMLLDEPTSAQDTMTEYELITEFNKLINAIPSITEDQTIVEALLVTSHRLAIIEKCQKILIIENGKLVDWGTHDELSQCNGSSKSTIYKDLLDMQISKPISFQFDKVFYWKQKEGEGKDQVKEQDTIGIVPLQ